MSGWSASAPASSIKSAPSCWNGASRCDRDSASCGWSYRASLPHRPMCFPPAWCVSLRGWLLTRHRLDERIEVLSSEIEELAKRDAGCERLMSIPGIGPIISSAMVAVIGTGDSFSKGRDFAAWLGLVPRQISTGDRTILGKISKRGNRYLRVLFVQAAWVVLVKVKPTRWQGHGLRPWIEAAKKRLHQPACHRPCQQARAHRVERSCSRSSLRDEQASGCCVIVRE